ncbi:MAG: hypothetical protein ALECFALPRED_010913 [Alectoria fallacina]|uniref:Uncharacterized protein n=1 Tax=Alectoria fallacina TaxID=1903189 RepID=A0A8H3F9Y9_9LECA|nr:MAG: hypothetical protein ALECFALPRED_010913 [Alectoria fallacina]
MSRVPQHFSNPSRLDLSQPKPPERQRKSSARKKRTRREGRSSRKDENEGWEIRGTAPDTSLESLDPYMPIWDG